LEHVEFWATFTAASISSATAYLVARMTHRAKNKSDLQAEANKMRAENIKTLENFFVSQSKDLKEAEQVLRKALADQQEHCVKLQQELLKTQGELMKVRFELDKEVFSRVQLETQLTLLRKSADVQGRADTAS